eukprot:281141-Rhodomonas_salina.2
MKASWCSTRRNARRKRREQRSSVSNKEGEPRTSEAGRQKISLYLSLNAKFSACVGKYRMMFAVFPAR